MSANKPSGLLPQQFGYTIHLFAMLYMMRLPSLGLETSLLLNFAYVLWRTYDMRIKLHLALILCVLVLNSTTVSFNSANSADISLRSTDIFVAFVALLHTPYFLSMAEHWSRRYHVMELRKRRNDKSLDAHHAKFEQIPLIRATLPIRRVRQLPGDTECILREMRIMRWRVRPGPEQIREYLVHLQPGHLKWLPENKLLPGCEDLVADFFLQYRLDRAYPWPSNYEQEEDFDHRDYSNTEALFAVKMLLGFTTPSTSTGQQSDLRDVVKAAQSPVAHVAALLVYGRLLSCIPEMTFIKLLVLTLGSLLYANEFELLAGDGKPIPRHHPLEKFVFGSLVSVYSIIAASYSPHASIGLGVGLFFVPIPMWSVALASLVGEVLVYMRGGGLGWARRIGALFFAISFRIAFDPMWSPSMCAFMAGAIFISGWVMIAWLSVAFRRA